MSKTQRHKGAVLKKVSFYILLKSVSSYPFDSLKNCLFCKKNHYFAKELLVLINF